MTTKQNGSRNRRGGQDYISEDFGLAKDNFEPHEDAKSFIAKCVAEGVAESQLFVDEQLAKFGAKMDDHEHRLVNLEKMVANVGKVAMTTKVPASEKKGLDKVLDVTLGTLGRGLHAVVDTSAFLLESAIDIATLGRAKQH